MSQALADALTASGLLANGDRVLVAVSGGPDSLSLLHALWTLRGPLGLASVAAAHLDHGLRGGESAADAAFVAAFCAERAIFCRLGYADTAAQAQSRKVSIQQAARDARYAFLEAAAQETGVDKIATAHTQDDQMETVLLNILRGTGLDGLGGIPARRGPFIRPLLQVSRADVLAYGETHGLTPRLDPSNLDATHYTRNRLRLLLLPLLARDYNPAVRQALLRLSQTAARDADYLHRQAETTLPRLTLAAGPGSLILDANGLRELHPALLRHVLRAAVTQVRGSREAVTHEHWEPLCDAICGRRHLPFGLTTPAPHCAIRVTLRRVQFVLQS